MASLALHRLQVLNHSWVLFVGFFCVLLGARFEVLLTPPYWDSLVGLFPEALWLSNNGFDFLKLASEQPGYAWGGPRVYFFTWYPSFQALLHRLLNDPPLFVLVNHLFTFLLSSLALISFYRILSKQFHPVCSLFGCLLLLVHPLFLSQSDAINMEMPLVAFTLMAIDCMLHDRGRVGALIALGVMYIKPTGILCVMTLFIVSMLVPEKERKTRWFVRSFLLLCMVLFAVQWWLQRSFYLEMSDTIISLFRGSLKSSLLDLPDFLGFYLVFGIFASLTCFSYVRQRMARAGTGGDSITPQQALSDKLNMTMLVFVSCFSLLYANIVNILPRYFLYCLPFLLYSLVFVFQFFFKHHSHILGAIVATAALFLYNYDGKFYPPSLENNGFLLERSLEYRDDMQLNMTLARHLENKYRDYTIVTSWPIVQMLTLPELGYVKKPLRVMTSDRPCLYAKTESFASDTSTQDKTVWVYSANCFSRNNCYYPEEDRLLEIISYGKRRVILFQRKDWRG